MTRKKWILTACALTFVLLVIWIIWGNSALMITEYTVASQSLPTGFDGFRIAHISDLHNEQFGEGNQNLLRLIREAEPDIIVVTGDLIDSYDTDVEIASEFMEEAAKIAPCYYVYGNHETRKPNEYAQLRKRMTQCGVTILTDRSVTLAQNGDSINIAGLMDYAALSVNYLTSTFSNPGYTLLLTHRPEHFEEYAQAGMDLVLAGHAHGGQIRLPFIGAVFAPGQGLFPKYADGMHTSGDTTMVVSRGLGNSSLPFRVNNRPELVIINLACE